ncbi:MAG: insulinase family protein [Acidobacteria bacterium]|nr:insulinase family protein [Acidobacteriota bacterium]
MEQERSHAGVEFVVEEDGVREYRLTNGLKVLLVENRVAPVVTFLVLYRVGSRNEAVGHTGATHLLEHMLFKGTPTFNKERRTQIAATLQRIGADYNATTWYDRTNYFETVPSDMLELAVRLEADRMRNSFIADSDRQSEMTVVRNELERGQNEPLLVLDEAVYATAFREHPYHHPTIGWRADVENIPTARLKEFYDTFYHPNNATAIVVGDFERGRALELISEHFGVHARSVEPIPEVYTDEPQQQGERRLVVRRSGELPLVQVAFRTPAALGQTRVLSTAALAERALNPPAGNDIYPLVVLSTALSAGVTSRLYQALVETELAVSVDARCDQFRDPGLFNIYATASPNVAPLRVEEVIHRELKRAAEEATEAEVEKAKRQIAAHVAYERDGTSNVALQMSEAEAVADWRFYRDYAANISRVTTEDVRRVALAYLAEDNRTVGHFIPKQLGGNGSNGAHANSSKAARAPHGWKFYRDPETDEETAGEGGADGASDDVRRGGNAGGGGKAVEAGNTESPESMALINNQSPNSTTLVNSSPVNDSAGFASRVARTELGTGAVLLVLENTATPTVSVRASLRAGSYFEPKDKPGLARIAAGMLERGTRRRTKLELAHDLESVGAEVEFAADPFAVQISARSLAQDFPALVHALAEMLREPTFPADELEKLKQQTVAAIQEQQSDTRARAYERLSQVIFDKANPFYTHAGERLVESVSSITVEDVRGFYEKFYGGRSLVLAVAGDVRAGEARRLFAESFAPFEGPESVDVNVSDRRRSPTARSASPRSLRGSAFRCAMSRD